MDDFGSFCANVGIGGTFGGEAVKFAVLGRDVDAGGFFVLSFGHGESPPFKENHASDGGTAGGTRKVEDIDALDGVGRYGDNAVLTEGYAGAEGYAGWFEDEISRFAAVIVDDLEINSFAAQAEIFEKAHGITIA